MQNQGVATMIPANRGAASHPKNRRSHRTMVEKQQIQTLNVRRLGSALGDYLLGGNDSYPNAQLRSRPSLGYLSRLVLLQELRKAC